MFLASSSREYSDSIIRTYHLVNKSRYRSKEHKIVDSDNRHIQVLTFNPGSSISTRTSRNPYQ